MRRGEVHVQVQCKGKRGEGQQPYTFPLPFLSSPLLPSPLLPSPPLPSSSQALMSHNEAGRNLYRNKEKRKGEKDEGERGEEGGATTFYLSPSPPFFPSLMQPKSWEEPGHGNGVNKLNHQVFTFPCFAHCKQSRTETRKSSE